MTVRRLYAYSLVRGTWFAVFALYSLVRAAYLIAAALSGSQILNR